MADETSNPFGPTLKQRPEDSNNGRTPVNPAASDNRPEINVETRVNKGTSKGFEPAQA
jgi:hypothetical protein